MDRSQEVTPKSLSCDGVDSWTQGINLVNFMRNVSAVLGYVRQLDTLKQIEIDGLTGPIKFDADGQRTNIDLSIVGKRTLIGFLRCCLARSPDFRASIGRSGSGRRLERRKRPELLSTQLGRPEPRSRESVQQNTHRHHDPRIRALLLATRTNDN